MKGWTLTFCNPFGCSVMSSNVPASMSLYIVRAHNISLYTRGQYCIYQYEKYRKNKEIFKAAFFETNHVTYYHLLKLVWVFMRIQQTQSNISIHL